MDEGEPLAERVRTLERALTDDREFAGVEESADLTARVAELEERTGTLAERLDELDAAVQAVRGYVGEVKRVNDDVERRADAALAAVESLEADVARLEESRDGSTPAELAASDERADIPTTGPTDATDDASAGPVANGASEGPAMDGAPTARVTDGAPTARVTDGASGASDRPNGPADGSANDHVAKLRERLREVW